MASKDMASKIRELRAAKGMTLEQVATIVGVGKSTVRKWETGMIANMRRDKIAALAHALDTTPAYLMGWKNSEEPSPKKSLRIPVYGNVAAGIPIEAITDIEEYEEITEEMARGGEYIALKIHGDSMEPRMQEGDVVIVHLQETIENGEIAVVSINRTETTCKKVKKTPDGIMLLSINPSYDPMYYSNKEIEELPITILGKVVELRAKF